MINAVNTDTYNRIAQRLSVLQPSNQTLCMADGSLVLLLGIWKEGVPKQSILADAGRQTTTRTSTSNTGLQQGHHFAANPDGTCTYQKLYPHLVVHFIVFTYPSLFLCTQPKYTDACYRHQSHQDKSGQHVQYIDRLNLALTTGIFPCTFVC